MAEKRQSEELKISRVKVEGSSKKSKIDDTCHKTEKRLREEFEISQRTSKKAKIDGDAEFPVIDEQMKVIIRRAQGARPDETLVDAHRTTITGKDIETLAGENWLNDNIIDYYLMMIVARARADRENFRSVFNFGTFFYPRLMERGYSDVKRWTKDVDIFSYSLLLIPVHLHNHLFVIIS